MIAYEVTANTTYKDIYEFIRQVPDNATVLFILLEEIASDMSRWLTSLGHIQDLT